MRKIYALIAMMLFAVCPMAMAEEAAAAEKEISWSSPVNYFSEGLNAGFSATIVGYTDGTYAIKGIYGSEDDLEFTIDSESVVENIPEIVLTNYYAESASYYYFHAGKYDICVYYQKGEGYTGWEGEAEEPSVWFYTYVYEGETCVGSGYDIVTWKKIAWSAPASYYSEALDQTFDATIISYTDGSYTVKGVYGSEEDVLEVTVDNENVIDGIPEVVLTNYYYVEDPYYYFHAGKYDFCTYYVKGTGYTGWEGDAEEPCLWFYTYLYEGENYVGAGYDTVYWNKADASSISSPKGGASASDRITSLSGINYSQSAKLPAGLYVKNGKKVLVTK